MNPLNRSRPPARVIAALAAVLMVGAGAVWLASAVGAPAPLGQPSASSGSDASPLPGPYRLSLKLLRVEGKRVSGRPVRRKQLQPATETVRHVMTELYSTGFVDPDRWNDGRFPRLENLFLLRARARMHRDLRALTLGPLARHLDAVRPRASTIGVRFVVGHRPIVAVASVIFRGMALAGDAELPVEHRGVYTLRRVDGRWRIASYTVRSRLPSLDDVERTARRAAGSPGLPSTGTFFLLVLGSDARPGESPTETRGDSIHIVGVNPAERVVSILGIPRDSYVEIPGVGTRKINEALVRGGPRLMVQTVERLSGVDIDGYVLTGFAGFQDLVNAVGGLRVDVPYRMSDSFSNAFFPPGVRRMLGRDALAFSRNRHDAPGGDFGRSMNQGRVLVAALRELKHDVAENPAALLNWIAAGARVLRTDLGLGEIAELLVAMPSLDPGRVENRVVSGTGAIVGGLSVVRLGASAEAMFRDIAADAIFDGRP